MAEETKPEVVTPEPPKEDWMSKKWRPMMAIMYMIACLFDFVVFPIMFTIVQFWEVQAANDAFRQWAPITLQGGGLFHVAMGAVLGVTAWSRGQEKIAGVANQPTMQVQRIEQTTTVRRVEPVYNIPEPEIRMVNGKPAPVPAYQPEI